MKILTNALLLVFVVGVANAASTVRISSGGTALGAANVSGTTQTIRQTGVTAQVPTTVNRTVRAARAVPVTGAGPIRAASQVAVEEKTAPKTEVGTFDATDYYTKAEVDAKIKAVSAGMGNLDKGEISAALMDTNVVMTDGNYTFTGVLSIPTPPLPLD